MRTNRLMIVSGAILILSGCVPAPAVNFRQPTETGSTISAAVPGTGDVIGTNEAMPQNTDSLETATATGAAIPITLTDAFSILYGDAPTAPTFIEYFDYDCEYCREHALVERPWIDREFVATKRMNVERIFAPQTPLGFRLAQAAICAGLDGETTEMDRALIIGQPANETEIHAVAKTIGLKTKAFQLCMQRKDLLPEKRILADGSEIRRVPTFRIGSTQWQGILPDEELMAKIEELLGRK
ncbi:MAG: thioredoxin domain-containing protein [Candidatus Peribacteraceae bacterium]|nr:thioredoxin domain-containing protein [Candidatus Peribacteraceae bacterium]